MNKFQRIDYFRKSGDYAKPTRTGGIVSILSVIVSLDIFLLLVNHRVDDQPVDRIHEASRLKGHLRLGRHSQGQRVRQSRH